MGKKKGGKSSGYISQGLVGTTKSRSKNDPDYPARRIMNQLLAFKAGKNVVLTIPNPNTNETNKPFIRVNARDVWRGFKR